MDLAHIQCFLYRLCYLLCPASDLSYHEIMIPFLINKYCTFSIINQSNECILLSKKHCIIFIYHQLI